MRPPGFAPGTPGDRESRPYGDIRTRSVGSTNSGAVRKPHQEQILPHSGPSGPAGNQAFTQILRAGNGTIPFRRGPRKWGPGCATWSTGTVLLGANPGGVLPNPSWLPAKPSEAGSPGRGGARERTQFSPSGGNGVEWTLRRRAAMGKVTRRPQAAKSPCNQERSSFSKASKARLDSSAFLFRFPLTRYPRGGMSPKFTFIG